MTAVHAIRPFRLERISQNNIWTYCHKSIYPEAHRGRPYLTWMGLQRSVPIGFRTPPKKYPAAVWHLLDALKRFDSLDPQRVMEITFEVARLGESGLDYANPEKKYTLSAYPGESFSGLQLMCLMYAGFKRIAPEQDTGMDLNKPWITALELFNAGKSSEDS